MLKFYSGKSECKTGNKNKNLDKGWSSRLFISGYKIESRVKSINLKVYDILLYFVDHRHYKSDICNLCKLIYEYVNCKQPTY